MNPGFSFKAIFAFLAAAVAMVGNFDYAAALDMESEEKVARVHRVLLETSMQPATLDECQRTFPDRPRPNAVVSFQNGERTPWHHRQCHYALKGQP